jgi:ribonuclease R
VKPYSVQKWYVHGDLVKARISKKWDGSRMAEVEIIHLIKRSKEILLAKIISRNNKKYIKITPEQWSLEVVSLSIDDTYNNGDIVSVRFQTNDTIKIIGLFGNEEDIDLEERLILFLSWARTEFKEEILKEGDIIKKEYRTDISKRTDFRDWFTFTIDGSDAKDLDDAISIKKIDNGNYLLAVHIADVSEYIKEWSPIDQEALKRATSIYTPGKVIPMLPEVLSNDLCSLHPGEPKLTLSCVMEIDHHGFVKHTDIVESIIQSGHRGIYEEVATHENSIWKKGDKLDESLEIAFSLYHILEKRRRKEWKITFESTEVYFEFETTDTSIQKTPKNIKRRERNNAHKLIEEFMVLANEEVAKWCDTHGLPFLSRVHGLPGNEQTEIIQWVLQSKWQEGKWWNIIFGKSKNTKTLEPTDIREFLESISDPVELYRYSRLLLPKMAKATYSDTPFRHFGLALEYYSHFTSPIRRYPDLQVHRIIKEKIQGKLSSERISHYKTILKRIARICSEQERSAEDIERAMNSLYACRYMSDKIWKKYSGQISGLAEFAIFVELENGIESTLYLPRAKYQINSIEGTIHTLSGKKIASIWEKINVTIDTINMSERRVVVTKN